MLTHVRPWLHGRYGLRTAARRHAIAQSQRATASMPAESCGSVPHGSEPSKSTPHIELTATESKLFDFLLYIQHLYAPTTQLRVAGGWVRDKLRGADSEDIDIVLDNIYGREFANHITKFQRNRKLPMSSVGVVKANSDKSKHLEVAQVRVEGLMVDFVHLRSEEYTEDSRIPDATFAAPAEDASRRDLTINALFYNLHTRQVEDFTGQGLDDLRNRVIRTPLEPYQTFLDDPLRVLRTIRFACEFGFDLDPSIVDAVMHRPEILEAMSRKVSRERIGIEVRKMLSGSNPARAFAMLAEFKLLEIVFHNEHNPSEAMVSAKELFTWTPEHVTRGEAHVRHLQESRKELDSHSIGFIEATGGALAPFVSPRGHINSVKAALETLIPTSDSNAWMDDVNEDMILAVTKQYRSIQKERESSPTRLPREAIVELLKVNVKWPKPAAKRVTFILEAIAAFPSDLHPNEAPQNHMRLFLWSTKYRDVVSPAIALLMTELTPLEDRRRVVEGLTRLTDQFTLQYRSETPSHLIQRRVTGNQISSRLGGNVGPHIGAALEVLAFWEYVYPSGTMDAELAFLDRLHPFLT